MTAPAPFCISIDEVQLHNVPDDCYYILYGDVFDFTNYVDEHPGGPEYIEDECGTDATFVYETARKHVFLFLQRRGGYDYYLGPSCSSS
jgi:cytochrome b involved in lipid metabolism